MSYTEDVGLGVLPVLAGGMWYPISEFFFQFCILSPSQFLLFRALIPLSHISPRIYSGGFGEEQGDIVVSIFCGLKNSNSFYNTAISLTLQ